MVEGLTIMLWVFRDLLYTYTMPNNHYCSTHMMAYHHLMLRASPKVYGKTKLWPTWGKKNANVWPLKYGGGTYNHAGGVTDLVIHLTNANHLLFNNLHAAIPPLDGQTCPEVGLKSKSEAWNPPTCGCKSMMDGLTIMLGEFINLLYTYTLPNNHYSTTYMQLYPHLMAKHWLKVGRKSSFFLIWGMKPANMWL